MDYTKKIDINSEKEEVLALQEIQSEQDMQSDGFVTITITTTTTIFWSTISNSCGAS